jgi:CDP-diacylglycerol--serine O-phosphatidyltransferase
VNKQLYPADIATSATILLGFGSIALSTKYGTGVLASLVLLSVLCDGLDGHLARRYDSAVDGEIYDTMSDIVSFSVAPSYLIFISISQVWFESIILSFVLASLYLLSSIIHLRKYLRNDSTIGCQTTVGCIPVCTGIIIGNPVLLTVLVLLSSGLMIASIEYPDDIPIKTKLGSGFLVLISLVPVYADISILLSVLTFIIITAYMVLAPHLEFFDRT